MSRPFRLASAALALLLPARAHAAAARKVAFLGCLAKAEDGPLGQDMSQALERRLVSARVAGFEFLPHLLGPAREKLRGGPVNPARLAKVGRELGADTVLVCLVSYQREHAQDVPATSKTVRLASEKTDYIEETYYEEVPNPDYEPPTAVPIPLGKAGNVSFNLVLGGAQQPRTIKEKHVRRIPRTRTVYTDVVEPDRPASEKPGFVRLRAAYVVMNAASGKVETRDTVSYYKEIEPFFDAVESEDELKQKAADAAVADLQRSILDKLPR